MSLTALSGGMESGGTASGDIALGDVHWEDMDFEHRFQSLLPVTDQSADVTL